MKTQTMDLQADTTLAPTMENLLLELSRYREQSERLRRINLLHQRLVGLGQSLQGLQLHRCLQYVEEQETGVGEGGLVRHDLL